MRIAGARALTAVVTILAVSVWAAWAAAATVAERWTVQSAASPGGTGAEYYDVSCSSPRACLAVGADISHSGVMLPMSEAWDGRRWILLRTPAPFASSGQGQLATVSCVTADACMAVGPEGRRVLAEWWNGRRWRFVAPVSVAHGYSTSLDGVSCVSASDCVAVGDVVTVPGAGGYPLVESWNGQRWRVVSAPTRAGTQSRLDSVDCPAASRCVAVGVTVSAGAFTTLAEEWNGHRWTLSPSPDPGSADNVLSDVSCASATECVAVGSDLVQHGSGAGTSFPMVPLAEHWDGRTWTVTSSPPVPARSTSALLSRISCASSTLCVAVGSHSTATRTLIETWNGRSWSRDSSPSPGPRHAVARSELLGVSCAESGACTAVGDDFNASHRLTPLIERTP